MWSNEIHLALKNVVEIYHQEERRSSSSSDSSQEDAAAAPQGSIGGFFRDGLLGWNARGSLFEVFCTKSGAKLVSHSFDQDAKTRNCVICSAEEVQLNETSCCVVAVVIQLESDSSMVTLLTVQGSRILGRIDVHEKLTCLKPVSKLSYSRGRIAEYNGCLAVGTASGKVLLIDACLKFEENLIFGRRLVMNKLEKNQCHIEFSSTDLEQIAASHALVRNRDVYFGLQLDAVGEEDSPVISLVDLPPLMAIAVGFADGRIVIYDLLELGVIHVAYPTVEDSPVVNMNLVEPTDDPKACVYIWAFHASEDGAFAVMHTLMYEEKYVESHGHVYEGFISCSPRLTVPCHDKGSFPLSVQSIMKTVSQEEEVLTLCVLSWVGSDKSTNIVVFDLNQWYKAEMPRTCDWRHDLNHTVVFSIKDCAVNVCLVTDSLVPFNSIQRPEEHFYPNSLSFDIIALNNDNCARYHWTGLQNKILDYFEKSGSACIMDPGKIYNIMLRAALMPQFVDNNFTPDTSFDVQREYLLSVALEYNCYSLLQECAINWADGSHLGQNPEEGVSLSTLTEWIWSRAKALKELSNNMCIPLFDLSSRRIDCGTQKTLLHCSRQLRQLTKLYDVIFTQCKQYIPSKVFKNLQSQRNSIQLAADYQEVVQWLLNVGLLPEGNIDGVNLSDEFLLVPFPYQAICSYYGSQRTMLNDKRSEKGNPASVEELSCKYLFIDNFIEREFPNDALRKIWIENNSSGVYPPNSMQNLLRALLVPNISAEQKYVLLCYTFMDMTAVLGEGRKTKYPSKVKLLRDTNEVIVAKRSYQVTAVSDDQSEPHSKPLLPGDQRKTLTIGGEKVIFTVDEVTNMKQMLQPGIQLLGFKPITKVSPGNHLRSSLFLYPDEGHVAGSTVLFRALYEKCLSKQKAAYCMFTMRRKQPSKLVALIPQECCCDEDGEPFRHSGFRIEFIPYAADMRKLEVFERPTPDVTQQQIDVFKSIAKKIKFKYHPSQFDNPVLLTTYTNIEALLFDKHGLEVYDSTKPDDDRIDGKVGPFVSTIAELFGEDVVETSKRRVKAADGEGPSTKAPKLAPNVDPFAIIEAVKSGKTGSIVVPTLRAYLQQQGVEGISKLTKADLVNKIKQHHNL